MLSHWDAGGSCLERKKGGKGRLSSPPCMTSNYLRDLWKVLICIKPLSDTVCQADPAGVLLIRLQLQKRCQFDHSVNYSCSGWPLLLPYLSLSLSEDPLLLALLSFRLFFLFPVLCARLCASLQPLLLSGLFHPPCDYRRLLLQSARGETSLQ